jgi:hypothetical protein
MASQATNEEVLSGKMVIPFTSQSRCWPGGMPGQLLFLQPMYFVQTPNEVWMLWERDHFVRRIYLTEKHSENVKPSWFGESIGHYEGGDTLVVDTIGLAAGKFHYIDSLRTPHTEKLHGRVDFCRVVTAAFRRPTAEPGPRQRGIGMMFLLQSAGRNDPGLADRGRRCAANCGTA